MKCTVTSCTGDAVAHDPSLAGTEFALALCLFHNEQRNKAAAKMEAASKATPVHPGFIRTSFVVLVPL